ncbi:hypothetical protein [Tenacibaculum xiamenense]|uniref:hypothetical protein n=1 Tax=Tenacibaculum xiamenense TaxID=1261553 RepID=UPI0038959053
MEAILKYLITPLIMGGLLIYSNLQSQKRIRKNVHGKFFLKLNSIYKWLGFLCCFIASFILGFLITHWNTEIYILGPLTVLLFLGMGVTVLIWYYNFGVVFDQKRITRTNWYNAKSTISWNEIENIKFNIITSNLKIYSRVNSITIPQQTVGFVEFLNLMEEKTGYKAHELKIRL